MMAAQVAVRWRQLGGGDAGGGDTGGTRPSRASGGCGPVECVPGDAAETALPSIVDNFDELVPACGLVGLGVVTAQAGQREGQQRKRSDTHTQQQAARPTLATGP